MTHTTAVLGFPRIGEKRELKFALEKFWNGSIDFDELEETASALRLRHWNYQRASGIGSVAINDFSLYDTMLDLIVALGAEPERFLDIADPLKRYFSMARGDATHTAMAMTKWFNTNYHYLVPELHGGFRFGAINPSKIVREYREAIEYGFHGAIHLIGPITFFTLSKCSEEVRNALFDPLLEQYVALIESLESAETEIVFHEPALSCDVTGSDLSLLKIAYEGLCKHHGRISVATYFEHSCEATAVFVHTPVETLYLDFVYGPKNIDSIPLIARSGKRLGVGIVDGRNIWINDMEDSLQQLATIASEIPKERLVISTSCSLLHVPYSLGNEESLSDELKQTMSFAREKLSELELLSTLFFGSKDDAKAHFTYAENKQRLQERRTSTMFHDPQVQHRLNSITPANFRRSSIYKERIALQHRRFNLPILPTTTIGSFPQTADIRKLRQEFKKGSISMEIYTQELRKATRSCIEFQESIGLDVLVHGEFERNDMVEYFGERLNGFAFSTNGWVQSYGSRCVKPPIIYGDVSRPEPMTLEWSTYAQNLTPKIVKGMLTGPVTILNWSFVRNDQPRSLTATQIAFAIRDEVDDLQRGGIKMIQVDEAAFKEGYPLRHAKREEYEQWALRSFLLSTAVADDDTQIHTHMCYSEFTDIIGTIEAMDADVISIETSRSGNRLLHIFKEVGYAQEVGPGVYDIHSPRIPSAPEMEEQIHALLEVLPADQLWVNPDCGLKTRGWSETEAALKNMVEATQAVRKVLS